MLSSHFRLVFLLFLTSSCLSFDFPRHDPAMTVACSDLLGHIAAIVDKRFELTNSKCNKHTAGANGENWEANQENPARKEHTQRLQQWLRRWRSADTSWRRWCCCLHSRWCLMFIMTMTTTMTRILMIFAPFLGSLGMRDGWWTDAGQREEGIGEKATRGDLSKRLFVCRQSSILPQCSFYFRLACSSLFRVGCYFTKLM